MASLELRGDVWHIRWRDRRGKLRSKSTKIPHSEKGDKLALQRLESFKRELERGHEPESHLLIGALLDGVISFYEANGLSSLPQLEGRIENHLKPFFGDMRAERFTTADARDYQVFRQKEKASNGTINRELSHLRRAFNLAREDGKIKYLAPPIPELEEAAPRSGFFEQTELEAVMQHIRPDYRPFIHFLFITGWRVDEARGLKWHHVDFRNGEIRLDPGTTKNDEGRSFPMTDELRDLLESVIVRPPLPHVFTYERWPAKEDTDRKTGKEARVLPIGDIRKAWDEACRKAGLEGVETFLTDDDGNPEIYKQGPKAGERKTRFKAKAIRHDFRRSAVRTFVRASVPPKVAMELSGHKTQAILERYNIVSQADLDVAREKLNLFAKRSQSPKVQDIRRKK